MSDLGRRIRLEGRGQIFGFSIPRFEYLVAAAVGLLVLVLVTHPAGGGIVALAIAAAVILPYAIRYVSHHVSGLLIVIVLIEAVAAQEATDTVLALAGSGPDEARLRDLAARRGKWLHKAAKTMYAATQEDWKDWKRGWKRASKN